MAELFPEQVIDLVPAARKQGGVASLGEVSLADSRGVHALWYALYNRPWSGLAVISPDDASRTWPLVQGLAATAATNNLPVTALSAMDGGAARVVAVSSAILAARRNPGTAPQRFLVAVDSPLHEPAAMAMFEACDAVLLLLWKGQSSIPGARRLLDTLGRERVIGAVLGSW